MGRDTQERQMTRQNDEECCSSAVERRTRNQVSPGSNPPFPTVSKIGHFRSLHDTPVHSGV